MGCCISKFPPKAKKFKQEEEEEEEYSYVQDKLVVSHYQSKACPVPIPEKKQFVPIPDKVFHIHIKDNSTPPPPKLSPLSPTQTSTTSNTSLSSSTSSLSTSSSVSVSKTRSFSNEFLQSCRRHNPHVVRINSLREASLSLKSSKPATPTRSSSPARSVKRYPSTPNRSNPNSKKGGEEGSPLRNRRIRANSPNPPRPLTRQKSFREEHERVMSTKSGRFLKSPSPSRRFGMAGSRVNTISCSERPESLDLQSSKSHLRNRSETKIHRIDPEIDEDKVEEVTAVSAEDIENPVISLECFIFL
ncbi:PREDICTED: putative protein TPRXL [Tarenaya hassleriana]|uniref:putative protein TPRXL n=1 Tax=Tarenaya hassleriana TaxID=28532 RepID=UPI00053C98C1|nr:PREDICTED: putative protein TPRXL [Tarenaya hassleriana]